MTRRMWATLLVLYALVAIAVPFVGTSVPSCSAPAGGQVSPECLARWEAAKSIVERFVDGVGVPGSMLVTFVGLLALTLVIDVARRSGPRDGS